MKLMPYGSSLSLLPYLSTGAISNVYAPRLRGFGPIDYGMPISVGNRMRRTGRNVVARLRKRRLPRNKKGGLELNKADGGFKNIVNTGSISTFGVNVYGRIYASQGQGGIWGYKLATEKSNYSLQDVISLTELLNDSNEFKNKLKLSSQYKVVNVLMSFDYTRVPSAKDVLPRLLLYPTMDKIDIQDPRREKNVMNISMSKMGVKNFNFNINKRNTKIENLTWQDAIHLWNGTLLLNIDQQDDVKIDVDEGVYSVNLGTFKITFTIKIRSQDVMKSDAPTRKINLEEEVKELKKKLNELKLSIDSKVERGDGVMNLSTVNTPELKNNFNNDQGEERSVELKKVDTKPLTSDSSLRLSICTSHCESGKPKGERTMKQEAAYEEIDGEESWQEKYNEVPKKEN
jgi:hypothetical protein